MKFYPFIEERTSILQSSGGKYARKSKSYTFTTENNIEYLVIFSQADEYFSDLCTVCHNIYEVAIEVIGYDKPPPKDYKIGSTVTQIVNHFIFGDNSYAKVLFFICQDDDHREQARFQLFKRWYDQYELSLSGFEFHERIVEFNNYLLYAGMIINPNYPSMETLIEELDNACEMGFNLDDPQ
jgi:hypothetical protein